jgi:hypothetical protein
MRVGVVVGIALLATGFFVGCVSTVLDRTDSFRIEGTVLSQKGAPLGGAEISFIDTGLDDWRRGQQTSSVFSQSYDDGRVAATYRYSWGYRMPGRASAGRVRDLGSRRFAIGVRLAGFTEERREFELEALVQTSDGTFMVPLGTIVMRQSEAGLGGGNLPTSPAGR